MKKILLLIATIALPAISNPPIEEPLISGPVELICHTPDPEFTSARIALISINPELNENVRHTRVLSGHISSGHWSALEHAYMTVKINCSRALSLQLIRHRSFTFQQFSQKYADTRKTIKEELPMPDFRTYGSPLTDEKKQKFEERVQALLKKVMIFIKTLLLQELNENVRALYCQKQLLQSFA